MHSPGRLHLPNAVRRFVVWCLLVAVPVFGFSGTVVELLGPNHVHRVVAASASPIGTAAEIELMRGWADQRRGAGMTTSAGNLRHPNVHSHGLFARHHHDAGDASVVALDGGPLQADTADEGGGGAAGSVALMAPCEPAALQPPAGRRLRWQGAAAPRVVAWIADGPLRPPRT